MNQTVNTDICLINKNDLLVFYMQVYKIVSNN